VIPTPLRPSFVVVALLAAAAWNLSAQNQQAPQTAQRPGETARRSPAATTGADDNRAVIRGRVVGPDGRSLRQAEIQLSGSLARAPRRESTDADGGYEASGLLPDSYTLVASKPGYATMEFGQRRLAYPGTKVRVGGGDVVERIDFTLPRASAITGRVSDENGDPVQGATVSLLQLQFLNGRRTLADMGRGRLTNDLGRFRLYGVQPGRYAIVASAAATGPFRLPGYAPTYYPGSQSASDAQLVTVAPGGDDVSIELRLVPGRVAKISGTAFDAGGQSYRGRLLLATSNRSSGIAGTAMQTSPQPDGTFEFINVAPGQYLLQTSGFGAFGSRFLEVSDTDIPDLTLRASIGSTVRGRITLEGAPARVRPQDFRFNFVLTDPDLGPAPGTYRAKITDEWTFEYMGLFGPLLIRPAGGPEWLTKSIRSGGVDITDTVMPFGRPNQSLDNVDVVLTNRGAELAGSVTDTRGQPVAACTVIVFAADRDRWQRASRFVKAARCDGDGTFTVRGLPTADYFAAGVDRIEGSETSGEWEDPAILESLVPHARRVALSEGQTTSALLRLTVR
jgi:protocatechuate 3,4-dioxygenase beta subunit